MWAQKPEGTVDDRFLTGFIRLGDLALYGYRSMLEFLPGQVLPALRDRLASFLPSPSAPALTDIIGSKDK